MADDKATPAAAAPSFLQEVSYLGARLREKSTYGGLLVTIGLLAPLLQKFLPQIGSVDPSTLATAIEYSGIGLGIFIGIFLPEKGSPLGKIPFVAGAIALMLLANGVAFLAASPARAASAAQPVFKFKLPIPLPAPAAATPAATTTPAPSATTAVPSLGDAIENFVQELQKIDESVVPNVIKALQAADADAGTIVTPAVLDANGNVTTPAVVKDPISHACYPAEIQYLQSLPTMQTTNVPVPYNLIVLFQFKRDFVNLLLSGKLIPTYLKLGCAPLLGDEAQIFAGTLGLVGVGAAIINPITAFGTQLGAAAVTALPLLAIVPK